MAPFLKRDTIDPMWTVWICKSLMIDPTITVTTRCDLQYFRRVLNFIRRISHG
jgi:hypothetical protein